MVFGLRILIIDDEPVACEMIGAMLVQDGHIPRTALSGRDGLRMFDSESFDLVLVDYRMPEMKGDEVAAAIKGRLVPRPVILISGNPPGEVSEHVDKLLLKPFSR